MTLHVKTPCIHVELGVASLCQCAFVVKLSVLMLFVLKPLATKNKALLIRWYTLHNLHLLLHILNGVARLHLELNGFAEKHLHTSLHRACKPRTK